MPPLGDREAWRAVCAVGRPDAPRVSAASGVAAAPQAFLKIAVRDSCGFHKGDQRDVSP